jgi:hypothetical protein
LIALGSSMSCVNQKNINLESSRGMMLEHKCNNRV